MNLRLSIDAILLFFLLLPFARDMPCCDSRILTVSKRNSGGRL